MSTTVRQLAELVHGKVLGDGDTVIHAARPLGEEQPGDITFADHPKYAVQLCQSKAAAVVVPPTFVANGKPLIQVADPFSAFVTIMRHLHGRADPPPHGIDPRAFVHPTAQVGPEPSIFPFASIGEGSTLGARCRIHSGAVVGRFCKLGDDVVLHPNVVLYEGTIFGDRVMIHANAVIGADGYGYRFQDGKHVKVPQLGHVEIGADVEVGACTTIDRGTFKPTRIGEGTKIDNLVQIGHNCQIGRYNLLISQMGMAGSSSTGDYVVITGQVGIVGHVHIGDRALIGAQAGVTRNVPAGARVFGTPATAEYQQKRILVTLEKLPEMRRDLLRVLQHLGLQQDKRSK